MYDLFMGVIGTDIQRAQQALEAGKLVGIPTETVYGLAANAMNPVAVAEIFKAKDRPTFHPLIVHTHSLEQARSWVKEVPAAIEKLTDMLWPGPLTVLLPKAEGAIPDIVTGGSPWIGIRVPQHPLTLALLRNLSFPLAAPSANRFGYVSPTSPQHVAEQLSEQVAYILDGGKSQIGVESTIVLAEEAGEALKVIRPGGISIELLTYLAGPVEIVEGNTKVQAPGVLKSHYATSCALKVGEVGELLAEHPLSRVGIISFQTYYPQVLEANQRILSPQGDLDEAAQNLFAAMRELDQLELDIILAEVFPEKGLGRAINDRLQKASA